MTDDEIIAQGYAPSADKRLGVDFDGTLFPFGKLFDADLAPFDGAAAAVRMFKAAGYSIYIFTSRLSPTWWEAHGGDEEFGLKNYSYVENKLKEYGIPFDRIGAEKIPCEYYIDDRAIRFHSNQFGGNNWTEIENIIVGRNT